MTQWHQIFAWILSELLTEVDINVQPELPLGEQPPQVDIVLLQLLGHKRWTAAQRERLPDGIRHSLAQHILIELKMTESFGRKAVLQALVYDSLYRWVNDKLSSKAVQTFIVVSKTPRPKRRAWYGYQPSQWPGVYHSDNVLLQQIPLLVLNELSNEPHNLFFKLFGSQLKAKREAVEGVHQWWWGAQLRTKLLQGLNKLFNVWTLRGGRIMGELTVEDLKNAGPEDVKLVVSIMLSDETTQTWFEELPQSQRLGEERRIEGEKRNLIRNILQALSIRFGQTPPAAWTERLEALELPALQPLFEQALTVNSVAEFEPHLPSLPSQ